MNQLLDRLQRSFAVSDLSVRKPGLTTLKVGKDSAEILIRELRDREGYTHLNFITCIDYIEDGIFTLVYMLHNYSSKDTLSVHVDIDREQAEMTSIHTLWAQAWTYQRELREMYGISFREFDTKALSDERFGHREGRHSEVPRVHMKMELYPKRGGDEQ